MSPSTQLQTELQSQRKKQNTPLLGPNRAKLPSREFCSESTCVEKETVPVPQRCLQAHGILKAWGGEISGREKESLKG